jgi:CPA2 family monovalent cation:H+ antiporter-2
MALLADLTLVLVVALAGGFLAERLRQPLIVGYIVAGVVVGPFTGGFTLRHVEDIEEFADLGVALLLFSLGLEVSFRGLAPLRAVAIGGGMLQIALTILMGAGLAIALGWSWTASIWFGAVTALSSTMVALKTLQTQGRLGTLSSRVMLGILVVQDLAVVPLMIVLPELGRSGQVWRVVAATGRAVLLLGLIILVATQVIPRLLALVARRNSSELFLITTLAAALGVGYAAWSLGLSMALGAFVAGLVVSESEYAHQALSDVAPLRDLFGMLFFVSVGMLLDPILVWRQLGTLAVVLAVVMLGKGAILAAVVRLFGYRRVVPLAVGLTLFQVGEFAFVLASVGRASGAIADDLYALVLNTAVATMALTPIVSGATPWLYRRLAGRAPKEHLEPSNLPSTGLADHIVIAGAGRVGHTVAGALARLGLPFVLVEIDDHRARQARQVGWPIVYGDARQPVVLEAAGLRRARMLLVTVPAFPDVRAIILTARRLRPELPASARADGPDAVRALYALGVEEVTSPEFEAAVEMIREALGQLGVPEHEIVTLATSIRHERYKRD